MKTTVGLIEPILLESKKNKKKVIAKIDTGASRSSIDNNLAIELSCAIKRTQFVKSANGSSIRPVVELTIEISNQKFKAEFTVADRRRMNYPVLIGMNILKNNFLIDPSK